METPADHWDGVYRAKESEGVSWYQPGAGVSLELINRHGHPGDSIIDVGAGASLLVDHLLGAGWVDLTLLDVSAEALARTRARLGPAAERVTFVAADVLTWVPERTYGIWHDRAVFHFLTDDADRLAYVRLAASAVIPGGLVVVGTFAEDGPEQCSGLVTARYDASGLTAVFDADFSLVESLRDVHRTPWGSEQPFTWVVLRRRDDG